MRQVLSSQGKSRATNGALFLDATVDERSPVVRRMRDLYDGYLVDIGGPEGLTTAQLTHARNAAFAQADYEDLRTKKQAGETIDKGLMMTYLRNSRQSLAALGLSAEMGDPEAFKRKPKVETLDEYFARKDAENAEE